MSSTRQEFWNQQSYVVIGDTRSGRAFPKLTFGGLAKLGKTVYAVDPGVGDDDGASGDKLSADLGGAAVYPDLEALPAQVQAAVLEVPKAETAGWVGRVADAGITNLWIHQQTDTPEALAEAKARGLRTEHGTCAVMYVRPGFSPHAIHRAIMKLTKKF
jgi:predicted CoA-binding protein